MNKEFNKYARLEHGISSMTMHRYESVLDGYINPTIIEERKMNVASMDVFSRLMMDRIIFLGVPIDDDVANIITAQLLFLASNDTQAIYLCISILLEDRYRLVLASMTRCRSCSLMWLQSVRVWLLLWVLCFFVQVHLARELHFSIRG